MKFDGASDHDLLHNWQTWAKWDEITWADEYANLAERAESLACNDPFVAALVQAHLLGTIGPIGLRSTSLYDDERDQAETTEKAKALRRQITAITDRSWHGRGLDAENMRSRLDLELALAWGAFVKGEGFAIRTMAKGKSRWRLVDARRIKNPAGRENTDTLRDGFVLDTDGAVVGVWVIKSKVSRWGLSTDETPIFIPWYAADGTPNIIHRVGYRLPGMMRGVTRLAPMIIMSRQLHGVLESHVAAKRLQAVHALIVEAQNTEEWKKSVTNGTALGSPAWDVRGPLNVWVKPPGSGDVQFTDPKFNGQDLEAYLKITYKVQCAAVQVPVDVVLCQMGEASLSSARAGLDQFDRTCQAEQERHIAECTSVMDWVEVAGAKVRGDLLIPDESIEWADILAAKYARPPKYSTDRLKDAETIAKLREAGVSGTTAFAMFGLVYEDERELVAVESAFDQAQGTPSEPGQPATPAPAPAQTAAPATEDQPAARAWWRRAIARISGHRIAA